jgi:hypothetical protein
VNCPKCDVKLKIKQVYAAGGVSKTSRAECPDCSRVYTIVAFLLGEAQERGEGAYAVAKRIRQRKTPPSIEL